METPTPHPAPDSRLWPERFDLIDAWRGLAALGVVLHHVAHLPLGGPSVMIFFVISGYCIAASADSCLRKGLGWKQFMWRRVRRIFPPYLLALLFWAATRVVKVMTGGENDLARTPLEWIQNITLTQWLTLAVNPMPAAPLNPTPFVSVFWSLCYEEQFYLIMGLLLVIATVRKVSIPAMVVALVAVALVWNALLPQVATGFFIEYWALFGVGALVFYRLCRFKNPRTRRLVDVSLVALAAVSIYLRWFAGFEWKGLIPHDPLWSDDRIVWGELAIGTVFALSLIAARPLAGAYARARWLSTPLGALGMITFSLYLIHQFNMVLMAKAVTTIDRLAHKIIPGDAVTPEWALLTAQVIGHVVLASIFWFFCERPFLNKSLLPAAPRPTTPAT